MNEKDDLLLFQILILSNIKEKMKQDKLLVVGCKKNEKKNSCCMLKKIITKISFEINALSYNYMRFYVGLHVVLKLV